MLRLWVFLCLNYNIMGILIKMIPTSKYNYLFIYEITDKEIIFRTSYNIQQLRRETYFVNKYICYFGTYNLDINLLIN